MLPVQQQNKMKQLPTSIQLEILSLLNLITAVEYAKINSNIYSQLIRDVRIITLRDRDIVSFHSNERFQAFILSLIRNPSRQLKLIGDAKIGINDFPSTCLQLPSSFYCLRLPVLLCAELFPLRRDGIQQIRRLTLENQPYNPSIQNVMQDYFTNIFAAITNREVRIAELQLDEYNFDFLPDLNCLQSLEIHGSYRGKVPSFASYDLSRLQSLHLYSCSIVDVSCLDCIPHLHFQQCHEIVDISSLNHNRKIIISTCNQISSYANSFRFSESISLAVSNGNSYVFNVDQLEHVKKLELIGLFTTLIITSLPKKLRSLYLHSIPCKFSIPMNHNLREIHIESCPLFFSLKSLANVPFVTLIRLNINSLKGLGKKNRRVRIERCDRLLFFDSIKKNDWVEINYCRAFNDSSKLKHVKHLYVTLQALDSEIILNGTKTLHLINYLPGETKFADSIKELIFTIFWRPYRQEICEYIIRTYYDSPNIQKIVFNTITERFIELDAVQSYFTVEFVKGMNQIVLLRR